MLLNLAPPFSRRMRSPRGGTGRGVLEALKLQVQWEQQWEQRRCQSQPRC